MSQPYTCVPSQEDGFVSVNVPEEKYSHQRKKHLMDLAPVIAMVMLAKYGNTVRYTFESRRSVYTIDAIVPGQALLSFSIRTNYGKGNKAPVADGYRAYVCHYWIQEGNWQVGDSQFDYKGKRL